MAEVLLFHHAQGLTDGVLAFAGHLREAGHVVHTPDLYDGATFATIEEGVAHAEATGFDAITARGVDEARRLPQPLVYAGFSLGVLPAQKLAQTRGGAAGALLCHAAVPLSAFGGGWPAGVPLQMHHMANDDWGDLDVAEELAASIPGSELFVYPGSAHLFADSSLGDFDPEAAALLLERSIRFLDAIE